MTDKPIKLGEDEYEKFTTVSTDTMRSFIGGHFYKKEFTEGFYLAEIIQSKDGWILRWKRRL